MTNIWNHFFFLDKQYPLNVHFLPCLSVQTSWATSITTMLFIQGIQPTVARHHENNRRFLSSVNSGKFSSSNSDYSPTSNSNDSSTRPSGAHIISFGPSLLPSQTPTKILTLRLTKMPSNNPTSYPSTISSSVQSLAPTELHTSFAPENVLDG